MSNLTFEPDWRNHPDLELIKYKLMQKPALVFAGETRKLLSQLKLAHHGQTFVFHAGECAESFENCRGVYIHDYVKLMSLASSILEKRINLPVCQIGRIAGQYAKPRSSQNEIVNGVSYPAYFGDIINGVKINERSLDPYRMLIAYEYSVQTLNLIRAFKQGGYNVQEYFNDIFSSNFITQLFDTNRLKLLQNDVQNFKISENKSLPDFYISHEALLLDYELCFERLDSTSGSYYNCGTHFLWLGERTRFLNSKQVDYLSRVSNPIGIKVGPNFDDIELISIIKKINPQNLIGKITLITRFGVNLISKELTRLLRLIHKNNLKVTWFCDPMHGNTQVKRQIKTRDFKDILDESNLFMDIMKLSNFNPGGIHLEVTSSPVTECIDKDLGISEDELCLNYCSNVDPRLNALQTLNLIKSISL